jgi:hypothetical protein
VAECAGVRDGERVEEEAYRCGCSVHTSSWELHGITINVVKWFKCVSDVTPSSHIAIVLSPS